MEVSAFARMQVHKHVLRQELGIHFGNWSSFPWNGKAQYDEGGYIMSSHNPCCSVCLHTKRHIGICLAPSHIQRTDLLAHNSLLVPRRVQGYTGTGPVLTLTGKSPKPMLSHQGE